MDAADHPPSWPPPPSWQDRLVDPPAPAGSTPDHRAVLPGRALGWALLGLVLSAVAAILASVVIGFATGQILAAVLAAQAALWSGLIGTTAFVSRRYGSGNLRRDYQLRFRPRDAFTGIGVSVLMRLAAAIAAVAVVVALGDDAGVPNQLEVLDGDRTTLLAFSALAVVGAPVVEELFFRGLLMRVLEPMLGVAGAVVVQAVLFGAAHAVTTGSVAENLVLMAALTAAGLALGITVQRAKRLGPAVAGHAWFNLVSLVLVAIVG